VRLLNEEEIPEKIWNKLEKYLEEIGLAGEIADVGIFGDDYFVVKLRMYGYWVTFFVGFTS